MPPPTYGPVLAASPPPAGVHYGPVFSPLCGVVVIAARTVFFTVGRFVLQQSDRRSPGGQS